MMRLKELLIMAGVALGSAASAACAQELVKFHWSFSEVEAHSTVPATGPLAGNGVIDPGEAARMALTVSFTPAVGSPISYTPPPGSGMGTVAGLAHIVFNLSGGSGAEGDWSDISRRGAFALGSIGTITPNGIVNAQAGQFPLSLFSSANPISNIWRVVWTPHEYTPRIAEFAAAKGSSASTGAGLIVEWSGNLNEPQFIIRNVPGDFGGLSIPVVPGPSGMAVVALGVLAAGRRQR